MPVPTTYPLVKQRKGIDSDMFWIPEYDGPDIDPAVVNAYSLPMADKTAYKVHDSLMPAPIYDGTAYPPATVPGNILSDGSTSLGLEFITHGRMMKDALGPNSFSQPEGGTGKLKIFTIPTTLGSTPRSGQLVRRSNEATAQIRRATGNYVGSFHYPFATAGRAVVDVSFMGSGREKRTTPAGFGSVTNDGYSPASYFNMVLVINGVVTVGLTAFDDTLNFNASRQEVGANSGYAGSINTGFVGAGGTLGLIWTVDGSNVEANTYIEDLALNQTEIAVDYMCADKPLSIATQWWRRRYWIRLERSSPDFGGDLGLIQDVKWQMVRSNSALWNAERFGDIAGPYLHDATHNAIGWKIDGAATISTIFPNSLQTADQDVATYKANGALVAVADIDNFNGRPRIVSKTKGSAGSVQCDITVANSCHVLMGLTGTIYAGYGTSSLGVPLIYENYNQFAGTYA